MFKPNRVGTPTIFSAAVTTTTANTAPNSQGMLLSTYKGNIVNAVPRGDFGHHCLRWAPATPQVLAAGQRWCLGLQFTVQAPLEGNTVGIEVNGNIRFLTSIAARDLSPIIGRLSAPGAATLDPVDILAPTGLQLSPLNAAVTAGTDFSQNFQYRDQIVSTEVLAADVGGTYFHGFCITALANLTINSIHSEFSVRQLNNQQTIGYRDTLR